MKNPVQACNGSPEQRYLIQTRAKKERVKEDEEARDRQKEEKRCFKQRSSVQNSLPGRENLELKKLSVIQYGEKRLGIGNAQIRLESRAQTRT